MRTIWVCFWTLLQHIIVINGIRNTALIMPSSIIRAGSSPTLLCLFDLEGAQLYSVKWYRGQYEFFRYMPKENPPAKIFHIDGIYVDIFSSNDHHVTLRNVPVTISGEVSCEVTTDSPGISTACVSGYLNVQAMDIDLHVAESTYRSGEHLFAECAATTPVTIAFYINSFRVPSEYVTQTTPRRASLNITLDSGHFRPRGDLRLQCSGGISDQFYISTRTVTIQHLDDSNGSKLTQMDLWQIILLCYGVLIL